MLDLSRAKLIKMGQLYILFLGEYKNEKDFSINLDCKFIIRL